jgi:hypothetical protein
MSKKTNTEQAAPPLPPGLEEAIRRIIRDVIATENDIELSIPDEEIERAAAKVFAPLAARLTALEAKAAASASRVVVAPKAARLDVLRASAAKAKAAKAEEAEARAERRAERRVA